MYSFLANSFIRRLDDAFNTQGCIHKFFQTLDLETGRFIVHGLRTVLFSTFKSSKKARLPIPNFPFREAILQIGGNNITEPGCPLELACKLEDLAGWLKMNTTFQLLAHMSRRLVGELIVHVYQ